MKAVFGKGQWNPDDLLQAYTFRYTQSPDFTQEADCISGGSNPNHPEGFDNISLLSRETFTAGASADLRCAFEGLGCTEIIIVPEVELCDDGVHRYGACFEVVLYKNGINVWRHYRENGVCSWHLRLGVEFPVAEKDVHDLHVSVKENMLHIVLDGKTIKLRTEDLPERFHLGLTVCEGVARVYDAEWRQA